MQLIIFIKLLSFYCAKLLKLCYFFKKELFIITIAKSRNGGAGAQAKQSHAHVLENGHDD